MKTVHRILSLQHHIVSIFLCSTLALSSARAETVDCTAITLLPATINSSGVYCLTNNLSTAITTGAAISINANNVTVDLNSWRLGNLAAGSSTLAIGIAAYDRKNITIRNGTIRGFYKAILLHDATPYTDSQGHLVEYIRAEQSIFIGLDIIGTGIIVRNNQIVDTGEPTVTNPAYGIAIHGPGARVLNNDIVGVLANNLGTSYALLTVDANGVIISNNRLHSITRENGSGGVGIQLVNTSDALITDNRITEASVGITFITPSTGKYMNNLTSNVTTPFSGGTAIGIND